MASIKEFVGEVEQMNKKFSKPCECFQYKACRCKCHTQVAMIHDTMCCEECPICGRRIVLKSLDDGTSERFVLNDDDNTGK